VTCERAWDRARERGGHRAGDRAGDQARDQPPDRDGRGQRDRGSATVVVLAAVAVVLAMTVGALSVVSAVVAAHRAQAAADLAALATAAVFVRGEPSGVACGRGADIAARNGGRLAACRTGPDLSVELVVHVEAGMARVGTATARSRAGPSATSEAG
jgi:secretion/DNA translocation related TadE-like protein